MSWRYVYDGHGHRLEVVAGAAGLGPTVVRVDGTEVARRRIVLQHEFRFTTEDKAAWAVRVGGAPMRVRIRRNGTVVSGWT